MCGVASATTCTQAHVFTTGETLTNTTLNANPANFVTCFSAIDSNNIGSGGIWASQIKPTSTAQATLGGQFGYVITPGVASQVPLTLNGFASQSVDLFDVNLTAGGTKALAINNLGYALLSGPAYADGSSGGATSGFHGGTGSTGLVIQSHATSAVGMYFDTFLTAGLPFNWTKNNLGTTLMSLTAGGALSTIGAISSLGGNVASTALGAVSAPGGTSPGDSIFQRGASTGAAFFGGATSSGDIDWNLNVANSFALRNFTSSTYALFSAGAYTNASDRRWKKDIRDVPYGLKAVERLKPSAFRWRSDNRKDLGFIAQDVKMVLPELVHADKRGYYLVNYNGIIPVLTKAIQEQEKEIGDLRKDVADMKRAWLVR